MSKKKVILASASKVKQEAVFHAFKKLGIKIELTALRGVDSRVNEQPIEYDTLEGARNRMLSALVHLENAGTEWDYLIAVENGIFWSHINGGQWFDKVVVSFQENKEKEPLKISVAENGVIFPNNFVHKAREFGFDKTTVGQVMFEDGFVEDPKDPHKTLAGRSRVDFITDEIQKIFKLEI